MKMWIARTKEHGLYLASLIPRYYEGIDYWCYNKEYEDGTHMLNAGLQLDNNLYPEVTFENSPQEVELKLIENMTQEDKELLLKDLCARLPYDIKVRRYVYTTPVDSIQSVELFDPTWLEELYAEEAEFKPYLFPLSSMTDEQRKELKNLGWSFDNFEIHNVNECLGTYREYVAHSDCSALIDWLNKNHFDYRGLIPKGFAIDATGLNIY